MENVEDANIMKLINALVYGYGGRECALANAIAESPLINKLFTLRDFHINNSEVIDMKNKNYKEQAKFITECGINLVIICDEKALCDGITDIFNRNNIAVIGINKTFSQLESSKSFSKKFMNKYGINNTKTLTDKSEVYPQMIKDNGLCKGKDCQYIVNTPTEKCSAIDKLKPKNHLIEEYLEGKKIYVVTYLTGDTFTNFLPVEIINNGNTAICPANLNANQRLKLNVYLCKLEYGLKLEDANFNGFITSELVWAYDGWCVVEYNISLAKLTAETLLTHIKSDIMDTLLTGSTPQYKEETSATQILKASQEQINKEIIIPENKDIKKYYDSVRFVNNTIISTGNSLMKLSTNSKNPIDDLQAYCSGIQIKD